MVRRLVSTGWHWQYGWLRRPDLDDPEGGPGCVYEKPNGDLVVSREPRHKKAMLLNVWEDDDGSRRFRPSIVPRRVPDKFGMRSS